MASISYSKTWLNWPLLTPSLHIRRNFQQYNENKSHYDTINSYVTYKRLFCGVSDSLTIKGKQKFPVKQQKDVQSQHYFMHKTDMGQSYLIIPP